MSGAARSFGTPDRGSAQECLRGRRVPARPLPAEEESSAAGEPSPRRGALRVPRLPARGLRAGTGGGGKPRGPVGVATPPRGCPPASCWRGRAGSGRSGADFSCDGKGPAGAARPLRDPRGAAGDAERSVRVPRNPPSLPQRSSFPAGLAEPGVSLRAARRGKGAAGSRRRSPVRCEQWKSGMSPSHLV